MTPSLLNKFLSGIPVLKRIFRYVFHTYENLIWRLFDVFFMVYRRAKPQNGGVTGEIRSVLHVSILSHKPYMLSRLMRKKGLESSYLAVHAEAGWLQMGEKGYDYNIPWNIPGLIFRPFITLHYFWRIVRNYDVIHYHFASFLTYDGRELKYLREMGKIIVVHFRGCDLRQKSVNLGMNPDLNCCRECDYPPYSCETKVQLSRIAQARKYADLLFVTTPDLLDFLPEASHIPFTAPYGPDLDSIVPASKIEGTFRVVTSSNHHGVDGTGYIRDAVRKLRDEGKPVELVEVHNTPFEEALSIYKSADVYAGKLRMGYYNNANIECMAMGVPCMSYIREEFLKDIPDSPIIITRPETVYQNLKDYIDRPEELKEIGMRGKEFVRKYHDPDMVAEILIKRYKEAR